LVIFQLPENQRLKNWRIFAVFCPEKQFFSVLQKLTFKTIEKLMKLTVPAAVKKQ